MFPWDKRDLIYCLQHNKIVVYMIPDFIDIGSLWRVLPPGIHQATLAEIESRFAITPHRQALFQGFCKGVQSLWVAGCKNIYLDGSYITEKEVPGDFDACWDTVGVDLKKLDPVLLDFTNKRAKQKQMFGGEFFPSSALADGTKIFIDFFQTDRHTGISKGIVLLRRV
jgi:hypothetical protein